MHLASERLARFKLNFKFRAAGVELLGAAATVLKSTTDYMGAQIWGKIPKFVRDFPLRNIWPEKRNNELAS